MLINIHIYIHRYILYTCWTSPQKTSCACSASSGSSWKFWFRFWVTASRNAAHSGMLRQLKASGTTTPQPPLPSSPRAPRKAHMNHARDRHGDHMASRTDLVDWFEHLFGSRDRKSRLNGEAVWGRDECFLDPHLSTFCSQGLTRKCVYMYESCAWSNCAPNNPTYRACEPGPSTA